MREMSVLLDREEIEAGGLRISAAAFHDARVMLSLSSAGMGADFHFEAADARALGALLLQQADRSEQAHDERELAA
jgi:hypothetical protein